LIAVEEAAIDNADSIIPWDGTQYDIPAWNKDQSLESAFRVSCVWCFQVLARRVGAESYRSYLRKIDYGELSEPFNETTFWLDGSLQISAIEQIQFLQQVYLHTLPFISSTYDTLRRIMLVEQSPDYTIRAKTGWATSTTPTVGWYVGYVETPGDIWFFALNMEIHDKKDLPLRQELVREALLLKEIIK
jgi:beta-lactamase class D